MTKVFPRSLAFVERMKAIAQMPQELAELFSDGESAQIETRSVFKLLTKARADPSLRAALDSQFRKRARKSVVEGKRVSVRVDLGGRSIIKKKTIESITDKSK